MDCIVPGSSVLYYCSNSCPLSQWCHSAISSSVATFFSLLPSIFPSIRVFSKELALHIRWPEYWSFSFSISPSNEYLGLISSRIDWLDLFAVQGTLKNLLQHHNSIPYSFHCLKTVTFATLASVTSCLFSQILRLCFWPLWLSLDMISVAVQLMSNPATARGVSCTSWFPLRSSGSF